MSKKKTDNTTPPSDDSSQETILYKLDDLEPAAIEALAEQLRPVVYEEATKHCLQKLKLDSDLELAQAKAKMITDNEDRITKAVNEWQEEQRKNAKPLSSDDLQKLLNQEYATFSVPIKTRKGSEERVFTLCELPSYYENKIYALLKNLVTSAIGKFSADDFRNAISEDWVEKLEAIMDVFDPALLTLAEVACLCLNPDGEDKEIDKDWVIKNLSNKRILNIIKAQTELNKIRDFFSELFQGFLQGGSIVQASARQ